MLTDLGELAELLEIRFSAEQLAAIGAPLEPGVIIAGAGTGKTTVMAARVVWLVGTGQVRPEQVLGLTFTRKAAGELGKRISSALAQAGLASDVDAGAELVMTYDAFAARLVRDFGIRLGIEGDAVLLSGASRFRLAAQAVARHENTLEYLARLSHNSLPERVLALDAALTSNLVSPEQLRAFSILADERFAAAPRYRGNVVKVVGEARAAIGERLELLSLVGEYRALKAELGLVEFADLQAQAVSLAREAPQVGQALRERLAVVLLDEYQDTSTAQVTLLRSLFSGESPQQGRGFAVTAVGDPNQAIYAWRGAAASNIAGFAAQFPKFDGAPAHSYSLSINRRSGTSILRVGNALAAPLGTGVCLRAPSSAPSGEVITRSHDTLTEELDELATDIASRGAAGQPWQEIAVLARRNDILAAVYRALSERGVPVEVVGLGGLLYLPEIAPVVQTLRLLADPMDNAAAASLLTGRRWRFGLQDMTELSRRAAEIDPEAPCLLDALSDPGSRLSQSASKRAVEFTSELEELLAQRDYAVADLVRAVITKLGLETEQLLSHGTGQLQRFVAACASFPALGMASDLPGLLAWLRCEQEHGNALEQALPSDENSVKLLTVHRAKGLEWHTVYLPALTQGVFPGTSRDGNWTTNASLLPAPLRGDAHDVAQLGSYDREGIEAYKQKLKAESKESEDRLAYVAATRAKQVLVLSCHAWAPGLKRARAASPYFLAATAGTQPPLASPENPQPEAANRASWPSRVTSRDRSHMAAAGLVAQAAEAITAGVDPEDWVWRSGTASRSEQQLIAQWDQDIAFLSDQLNRRHDRELVLPAGLSATALMELGSDPEAFAARLVRRMPSQPRRTARLGERFHEWVASRYQSSPGFDELEFGTHGGSQGLERLKRAFEASDFATQTPLAVEAPFLLCWGQLVLRGRIDAVFPAQDQTHDALIVDWKIGTKDPNPLQLAIYRQAWAQAQGIAPERVATGFHHVLANRFQYVAAGPELIEAAIGAIR